MQRTWFITGTSSGLGRIMTEQLLARGDRPGPGVTDREGVVEPRTDEEAGGEERGDEEHRPGRRRRGQGQDVDPGRLGSSGGGAVGLGCRHVGSPAGHDGQLTPPATESASSRARSSARPRLRARWSATPCTVCT